MMSKLSYRYSNSISKKTDAVMFWFFQTIFLTIALLPFRLAAITTLMILAWLLACFGLHGLSEEDLRRAPLTGWRRYV